MSSKTPTLIIPRHSSVHYRYTSVEDQPMVLVSTQWVAPRGYKGLTHEPRKQGASPAAVRGPHSMSCAAPHTMPSRRRCNESDASDRSVHTTATLPSVAMRGASQ